MRVERPAPSGEDGRVGYELFGMRAYIDVTGKLD